MHSIQHVIPHPCLCTIPRAMWCLRHVPSHPSRTTRETCWVYRLKRDAAGKVVKYKEHLIVKGFLQIPEVDFNETFANFSILIALAARYRLKTHGMDIVAAYLNSPLEETVYMQ